MQTAASHPHLTIGQLQQKDLTFVLSATTMIIAEKIVASRVYFHILGGEFDGPDEPQFAGIVVVPDEVLLIGEH